MYILHEKIADNDQMVNPLTVGAACIRLFIFY